MVPLTNWGASKFKAPARFLERPPLVLKPLVTVSVCPLATWMMASEVPVAPKETTGTPNEAVAPEPEPVARIAPEVSVNVVGLSPARPPTAGLLPTRGPVLMVRAFSVWLPVSEFAVAEVALKVWVGDALSTLVTAAYPVKATMPLVELYVANSLPLTVTRARMPVVAGVSVGAVVNLR